MPAAKPKYSIPDHLKKHPVVYAGEIGTFGLGGEVKRSPRKRGGMPDVPRGPIAEATPDQYEKLLKTHPNGIHGIYLDSDRRGTPGGE